MAKQAKHKLHDPELGGVEALFDDIPTEEGDTLSIEAITRPKKQPRRYFDEEGLQKLAASIKEKGILQPLIVRNLGNGSYELVAGERRYKAAKKLGLQEVPVVVRELSDEEALELALMENLQREDLNPVEETEGVLELLEITQGIPKEEVISVLSKAAHAKERGQTLGDNVVPQLEKIKKVLSVVGTTTPESFRKHRLPLLKLSEDILVALRQGEIQYTKARAIDKVKDEKSRRKLLEQAIAERWPLSEVKAKIKALKEQGKPKRKSQTEKLIDQFEITYNRVKKAKDTLDKDQAIRLEQLLKEIDSLLET